MADNEDAVSFWTTESIWFYVTLLLGAVLIFQAGSWYGHYTAASPTPKPNNSDPAQSLNTPAPQPTDNQQVQPSSAFPELPAWIRSMRTHPDKKALGNPDAPVTATEYIDFQCPFCQRFNHETFPKLRKTYIKTGQVYYRVKHFPLGMHERAVPAGNAAECAAQQNKFWAYKYTIMNSDRSLSNETLIQAGRHINVPDFARYKRCVRTLKYKSRVKKEQQAAANRGVTATPTVFVGETKIEGAQPYSRYKQAIKEIDDR
jgi:protein-disulfide isomerase